MHPLTRELAVKRASSDGQSRIVAQANSLFIVTPDGAVWQVFDADLLTGETHSTPRDYADVWARIFIGADEGQPVRIYRFGAGESRSTAAHRIYEQLERARS
jgi:hypothetical protein